MNHVWTCRCCGRQFNALPLDFACEAPDHWFQIPESERDARGKPDSDVCMIDGKDIFVRGCLEIPVIGHEDCSFGACGYRYLKQVSRAFSNYGMRPSLKTSHQSLVGFATTSPFIQRH